MTAIRQHGTIKLFTGILIFPFLTLSDKSDEYVHIYKVVHSYSQLFTDLFLF